MKTQKREIAILLAAVLALSLLLTACGNGGETPAGDNTTPRVTGIETPDNTPDGENTNTPDTSEPTGEPDPTPGETTDPTTRPTRPDVSLEYDDEKKIKVDELLVKAQEICNKNDVDVNLENVVKEVYDDYYEYLDERITYEAIRTAVALNITDITIGNLDRNNISRIKNGSFEKANDFVISKVGNALDIKDPKQNIAAWAIASSLAFITNWDNLNDPYWDLATSFTLGLYDGESTMVMAPFPEYYYVIIE